MPSNLSFITKYSIIKLVFLHYCKIHTFQRHLAKERLNMFSNLFEATLFIIPLLFSISASVIFILIICSAVIAGIKFLHHALLRYEVISGTAKVTALECEQGTALFGDNYFVRLTYAGKDYRIFDEDLYHSSLVNDVIPVQVHLGFNRSNMLVHQYITKH